MKSFYLEEFKSRKVYIEFIKYMLEHSDYFSLIYFKNKENEKVKVKVKQIADSLKGFKISSKNTQKWPNTETCDKKHIYKLVFYNSDIKCFEPLTRVNDIYEWDYPNAPMDLCFYKNGYCWLAITSHEHFAYLYTNEKKEVEELSDLGAKLFYEGEEDNLYYI